MAIITPKRIDLFIVNQLTGVISVLKGGESSVNPVIRATPSGAWALCSLYRVAGVFPVAADLTDLRPAAVTALDATTLTPSLEAAGLSHNVVFTGGQLQTNGLSVVAKRSEAVRYGVAVKLPARGQYNLRIRRTTPDRTGTSQFDEGTWAVLRSIKNVDPIAMAGVAKIAMRIKATDQLSGVIDTFNCIAESVLPDWDSATQTWITRRTSNPAAMYRDVLQGSAMKLPVVDSRLDLPELQAWWEECQANGYAYRSVIDYQSTPFEMLRNIAAVGRARFTMRDGLFSVVRDSPAILAAGVKQVITPRNSWDIKGEKSFAEIHGVTIKYINQALDYRQDEVTVYAAGYTSSNATKVDTIELPGVTLYWQAWKMANYYLAVAILRPEMHSRMLDVEHLVVTTGDLIRVTDDVAMHGLTSGRISALVTDGTGDVTGLAVDEICPMDVGKTYAVRLRYATGGDLYRAVTTVAGEHTSLTFAVPVPAAQAPEVGDLLAFGETDQETAEKIVHHIEMSDDLTARLFYVDAAPGVYTADSGTLPLYNPQITIPGDIAAALPGVPVITGVISDETVMTRNADGGVQYHIAVTCQPTAGPVPTEAIELQYKESTEQPPWTVVGPQPVGDPVLLTATVERGTTYNLRARAVGRYGRVSDWVTVDETVIGMSRLPNPVTNLRVENSTGDGLTFADVDCHLVWDAPAGPWDDPARIDHYHVEIWDTTHTTLLYSDDVVQTRFDLTLAKNQALTGGPYRTFQLQITVVDVFKGVSSAATLTPINPQSPQMTGLVAAAEFGLARLVWDEISDLAVAAVEVHASQASGFVPGAATLQVTVPGRTREHRLSLADGTWYLRIGAFDVFGQAGMVYSTEISVVVSSKVDATNVLSFHEEISKLYRVPVTQGAVWSNNGTDLSWSAHDLYYLGVKYSVAAGSTTAGNPFVYWAKPVSGSATIYLETNNQTTFDNLNPAAHQWQIAINNGSSYDLAWVAAANMVIGTGWFGKAVVQNENIGNIIQSTGFQFTPETTPGAQDGIANGWQLDKNGNLTINNLLIVDQKGGLIMSAGQLEWSAVAGTANAPASNADVTDYAAAAATAQAKADAAEANAIATADLAAQAKADLAQTNAQAHADGIVTAEEARAIADAQAKADAAEANAKAAAALDATAKVDAVAVGGRNLIIDSTNYNLFSYLNGSISASNVADRLGGASATTLNLSIASYDTYRPVNNISPGIEYTVSGWVLLGTATNFVIVANDTTAWNTLPGANAEAVGSGWVRFGFNFIGSTSGAINLHIGGNSEASAAVQTAGTVTVCELKLEEGNKATAWTPAPEDVSQDAQAKADAAQVNAIATADTAAQAKADLAQTNAQAHADGIVTAEEARAIADAQAKADAAEANAKAAAALDATAKADAAQANAIATADTAAQAKADLAQTNAQAHADGIVTAEEARAIADAQAKADAAEANAKAAAALDATAKADAAQANAEAKAGSWYRDYSVNTATPDYLRMPGGQSLEYVNINARTVYQAVAFVTGTGTITRAEARFTWNGTDWVLLKMSELGTSSNHPEFFIDAAGFPAIRLYGHTSFYPVRVTIFRDLAADETKAALEATTTITKGGLTVSDTVNGEHAKLVPGDLVFDIDGVGSYKSVRRIEVGTLSSGDYFYFTPPFKTVPKVIVSAANVLLYDAAFPSSDQSLYVSASEVTTAGFRANSQQYIGGAAITLESVVLHTQASFFPDTYSTPYPYVISPAMNISSAMFELLGFNELNPLGISTVMVKVEYKRTVDATYTLFGVLEAFSAGTTIVIGNLLNTTYDFRFVDVGDGPTLGQNSSYGEMRVEIKNFRVIPATTNITTGTLNFVAIEGG